MPHADEPTTTPGVSLDFIRQIVEDDLASGKHTHVATRFPPEPNGYLHIGHAKSICLNFGIARERNGTCNLRLDDTNPVKEDVEYVDSIKEDVAWLGFTWNQELYASDYFEQLYRFAVTLIERGLAYVDSLTPDQIREYRGTLTQPGRNSPYRDRPVAENLDLFARMRAGEHRDGDGDQQVERERAAEGKGHAGLGAFFLCHAGEVHPGPAEQRAIPDATQRERRDRGDHHGQPVDVARRHLEQMNPARPDSLSSHEH